MPEVPRAKKPPKTPHHPITSKQNHHFFLTLLRYHTSWPIHCLPVSMLSSDFCLGGIHGMGFQCMHLKMPLDFAFRQSNEAHNRRLDVFYLEGHWVYTEFQSDFNPSEDICDSRVICVPNVGVGGKSQFLCLLCGRGKAGGRWRGG